MFAERAKNDSEQRGVDERGARLKEPFMEVQHNNDEFKNHDPVFASAIAALKTIKIYMK